MPQDRQGPPVLFSSFLDLDLDLHRSNGGGIGFYIYVISSSQLLLKVRRASRGWGAVSSVVIRDESTTLVSDTDFQSLSATTEVGAHGRRSWTHG